jgi:uncharacterized protein YqjF (DUF2071 family)
MPRTFLTAEWRKLIMTQYAIDPAILAPLLPAGTELDLFAGRCYVSLVGFLFDRVRVKGLPIPFHRRFEEINLRFYVLRRLKDGYIRRGVVFVREIVPRRAIAVIARRIYEEPYAVLPTSRSIERVGDSLNVCYSWLFRGQWQTLSVEASPIAQPLAPQSEEAFIFEHYWGYTRRTSGGTAEYEVRHPSWEVYPVVRHGIHVDFGAIFGPDFAALNRQPPGSVLLAEGSAISVLSVTRIGPGAQGA